MVRFRQCAGAVLLFSCVARASVAAEFPEDYTWTTESVNSSESMPCGGGDIGMNVWVEGGELLFYLSRSGAYDEHNTLLKQGRVRIRIGERTEAGFRQTLRLKDGYVEVSLNGAKIRLWADVSKPVIHVEAENGKESVCEVAYESWRYADRILRRGEGRQNSLKWSPLEGLSTSRDSVRAEGGEVTFFHRNPSQTVFDRTVSVEGLEEVKHLLWNPLGGLISGGRMRCEEMEYVGTSEGTYAGTDYRAWNFRPAKPVKKWHVVITLHMGQCVDAEEWETGLARTEESIRTDKDRKASRTWWNAFWERSYICGGGEASMMTRNYTLFRYMLGCNAYGTDPTKFNGGLFTFDPVYVDSAQTFTPDYRNWGGGTMTAQNQRLVYWPMLKSGDFDMMESEFGFYERMLRNAEVRTRHYWGHGGACFSEQTEQFGLPNMVEYGLKRPEWFDKGVEWNAWLEYEWDTVLEFCQMILETRRYAGVDISRHVPLIESVLTFFDEHYQYLASRRGRKALDEKGKLVLYPGSGCETYKMAYNASSTVAGLRTVLETYVKMTEETQGDSASCRWREMLGRIPEIPLRSSADGVVTIAPAEAWERVNNVETPQLYPVFPWRVYGCAAGDAAGLEVARATYARDADALRFRSSKGWKQDNIWAACLGLTGEAVRLNREKLSAGPNRFPAFWGPDFDWTPDCNRGGSGMIGLQEMLMQCGGDGRIVLFPAWPREWDVSFKLHAPQGTVVEAELTGGKVTRLRVTPEERQRDVSVSYE